MAQHFDRLMRALLVALLGSGLAACGGGGGGGGGGTPPPPTEPGPSITYESAAPASAASLYLTQIDPQNEQILTLRLRAEQVEGLYGVAFDLEFPSQLLEYSGVAEGGFFSAGGRDTSLQIFESAPGNLVVGLTRLGNVPGANGSGTLLELDFTAQQLAGTGDIVFDDRQAFDRNGNPGPNLTWIGGEVEIVR